VVFVAVDPYVKCIKSTKSIKGIKGIYTVAYSKLILYNRLILHILGISYEGN
jgi:hypothetical protein